MITINSNWPWPPKPSQSINRASLNRTEQKPNRWLLETELNLTVATLNQIRKYESRQNPTSFFKFTSIVWVTAYAKYQ